MMAAENVDPETPAARPEKRLAGQVRHRRIAVTVSAVVAIAAGSFLVSNVVLDVPKNTDAIRESCRQDNARLQKINDKFAQLVALFDSVPPPDTPPSAEVLAAYAEFRKPIPLAKCDRLAR